MLELRKMQPTIIEEKVPITRSLAGSMENEHGSVSKIKQIT